MNVFVAGASGAIGQPLIAELIKAGHSVVGLTQSPEGAKKLRLQGCEAVVADALDASAVESAVRSANPEIIIDQLTSLPKNPADFAAAQSRDTKLRLTGGANLLLAADSCGVRRFIQQSSGFLLKAVSGLADESTSFLVNASAGIATSARMYTALEKLVLSPHLETVILRYGFFYGPGTWYEPNGGYADLVRGRNLPVVGEGEAVWSWIHVEDAALATVAALDVPTGVYNIVDGNPCSVKVWLPAFAASIVAPPPPTVSATEALRLVGEDAVFHGTKLMGATNEKARSVFSFRPRRLEWLSGQTSEHA